MKLTHIASIALLAPLFLANSAQAGTTSLAQNAFNASETSGNARFIRPWELLAEQETEWQQAQQAVRADAIAQSYPLQGIDGRTLTDWSVGGQYPDTSSEGDLHSAYGRRSTWERLQVQFEKLNQDWENTSNTVERDFRNTNERFPVIKF